MSPGEQHLRLAAGTCRVVLLGERERSLRAATFEKVLDGVTSRGLGQRGKLTLPSGCRPRGERARLVPPVHVLVASSERIEVLRQLGLANDLFVDRGRLAITLHQRVHLGDMLLYEPPA